MDFEAVVHLVLPVVTGQGARGEWRKQEVIFELPGEFSRKICVGFWNEKANDAANLRVGDRIAVSVNIESRERNGRWFTEVRGWKMSRIEAQPIMGGYAQPPQGGYGQSQGAGYGQQPYGGGYGQPQGGGFQQPQASGYYNQPQGGFSQPYAQPQQPATGYSQPESEPAPVDDLPF